MSDRGVVAAPPGRSFGFAAAVGLTAAVAVARYTGSLLGFLDTLFGDPGWPLAVDAMLDAGLVPTRDFGYFYGLLALPIDRAWFAVFGRTPHAVAGLTVFGSFLLTVGIIRFGWAAVPGVGPRAVLVAAVPYAVMPLPYPTPLHVLEAALLVNALAFQARGRLAAALALATVAVFIKPGLAYVYGLVLVLLVLTGPGSWRTRLRQFLPAAIVGLVIAAGLAAWFGVGPLFDTLFPLRAAQNYRDENFGFFFGVGREFWWPGDLHPLDYVQLPVGFWLIATGWLLVGAARRISRLREPVTGTMLTCAVLHLVFVVFLFGNQWSWLYYSAILMCGMAAAVADTPLPGNWRWLVPGGLAVLAVAGQKAQTEWVAGFAFDRVRTPATAGLYAQPRDAEVWERVRELGKTERVLVLSPSGGAFVAFPGVDSPRSWFLLRSTATPAEIERVRKQLQEADWLVVSTAELYKPADWSDFREELNAFRDTQGEYVVVEKADTFLLVGRRVPRR